MPTETLRCRECGSPEITEFKPATFVCNHCEAVFKYVDPTRLTVDVAKCACGFNSIAACVACSKPLCSDHVTPRDPPRGRPHYSTPYERRLYARGYGQENGVVCYECRHQAGLDEVAHNPSDPALALTDPMTRGLYMLMAGYPTDELQGLVGHDLGSDWLSFATQHSIPMNDRVVQTRRGDDPRNAEYTWRTCWFFPGCSSHSSGRNDETSVQLDVAINGDGMISHTDEVQFKPRRLGGGVWERQWHSVATGVYPTPFFKAALNYPGVSEAVEKTLGVSSGPRPSPAVRAAVADEASTSHYGGGRLYLNDDRPGETLTRWSMRVAIAGLFFVPLGPLAIWLGWRAYREMPADDRNSGLIGSLKFAQVLGWLESMALLFSLWVLVTSGTLRGLGVG